MKSAGFFLLFFGVLFGAVSAPAESLCEMLVRNMPPVDPSTLSQSDPPGRPLRRLKRITGGAADRAFGQDFADPSPPDASDPRALRVYTTAGLLTWPSRNTGEGWTRFLRGEAPRPQKLRLYHADGVTPLRDENGEDAWDITIQSFGGRRVLYGGVMSPAPGQTSAFWPQDHFSRRTFAFLWDKGRWVRQRESVFGEPLSSNFEGHNYGHAIVRDEKGQPWMFYEKVTAVRQGLPWATEIFARRMLRPVRLEALEIPILLFPKQAPPAARRSFGGVLAEGPRPFYAAGTWFISFSAGDYNSDHYGIHLATSPRIDGPYRPLTTRSGDFLDLAQEIDQRLNLTWGAGRGAFFQDPSGEWWVLFHGIPDSEFPRPPRDPMRDLFLAPVRIVPRPSGPPEVCILTSDEWSLSLRRSR